MGQKSAAYDSQGARLVFYDSVDSPVPQGVNAVEITDEQWLTALSAPGYTLSDGGLIAPAAPSAAEIANQALLQSAQVALQTGLTVTSTGSPALNAKYSVDPLSQADIVAIETSLNAGKGFPGGAAVFSYPDASGTLRVFTQENFTDFAAAVRDYVYALKSVMGGQSSALPSASITIA